MIIQCAACQTRFKIADEKVTERGVKVRCSKCANTFVVRKEGAGPAPAEPVAPRQATMQLTASVAPLAAAPRPAPRQPTPPPAGRKPAAPLRTHLTSDPFASSSPAPDPFSGLDFGAAPPAAAADPFGEPTAPGKLPPGASAADPFAMPAKGGGAPAGGDPFGGLDFDSGSDRTVLSKPGFEPSKLDFARQAPNAPAPFSPSASAPFPGTSGAPAGLDFAAPAPADPFAAAPSGLDFGSPSQAADPFAAAPPGGLDFATPGGDPFAAGQAAASADPFSTGQVPKDPFSTGPAPKDPFSTGPAPKDPFAAGPSAKDPFASAPPAKDPFAAPASGGLDFGLSPPPNGSATESPTDPFAAVGSGSPGAPGGPFAAYARQPDAATDPFAAAAAAGAPSSPGASEIGFAPPNASGASAFDAFGPSPGGDFDDGSQTVVKAISWPDPPSDPGGLPAAEPAPPPPPQPAPEAEPAKRVAAAPVSTVSRINPKSPAALRARRRRRSASSNLVRTVVLGGAGIALFGIAIAGELREQPSGTQVTPAVLARSLIGQKVDSLPIESLVGRLFETRSGRPVYLVIGTVRNLTPSPAGPLVATVRMARPSGEESVAAPVPVGFEPTPEQIFDVTSPDALAALVKSLAGKAPALAPGADGRFVAIFYDYPDALSSVKLAATLAPAPAAAPEPSPAIAEGDAAAAPAANGKAPGAASGGKAAVPAKAGETGKKPLPAKATVPGSAPSRGPGARKAKAEPATAPTVGAPAPAAAGSP